MNNQLQPREQRGLKCGVQSAGQSPQAAPGGRGAITPMNYREPTGTNAGEAAWHCLHSHSKHEHIAAAHLRSLAGEIDVFCPRLRIRRRCRRGAVWFIEALFPGYLFARFRPDTLMQAVRFVPGVKAIVSFGLIAVTIRDEIIEGLREGFDQNEVNEVTDDLRPGDEVTITTGPFLGLQAHVLRLIPAADRVQLLLELLGRTMPVEVAREHVVTQKPTSQLLAGRQGRLVHA